jgi:hypothetical protein
MEAVTPYEPPKNPLLTQLQQVFQENAPEWKLISAAYADDGKIYSEWIREKDKVILQIVSVASPEAAASHLQMFNWHIPLTPTHLAEMQRDPANFKLPQPVMSDYRLANLGDENLVWSKYDETGSSLIKLRKGNLIMQVDGSSLEVAERIARLVVAHIRAA